MIGWVKPLCRHQRVCVYVLTCISHIYIYVYEDHRHSFADQRIAPTLVSSCPVLLQPLYYRQSPLWVQKMSMQLGVFRIEDFP